ncbi:unnamed protein product [Blepharisma stoltei]|uniref:Uncharacterized protein n=1 Tax=Blepharisma stoltei TaxID=1481888 RepID=A0AAU9J188_9CILI|nr:unnamed protein product [Blepharisma stoltei]
MLSEIKQKISILLIKIVFSPIINKVRKLMQSSCIPEFLMQREIEGYSHIPSFSRIGKRSWTMADTISNHDQHEFKPNSSIVLTISKANHLIIIDKYGRCNYRSIFPFTNPLQITKSWELCVKALFWENDLIILLKQKNSEIIKFYKIRLSCLEENAIFRKEILFDKKLLFSQIDKIDYKRGVFTYNTIAEFQVWDIVGGAIMVTFAKSQEWQLKYSNCYILRYKNIIEGVLMELHKIDKNFKRKLQIMGLKTPFDVEVINESIICFVGALIFAVNFITSDMKIINEGAINKCYELEGDNMIVNFWNGKILLLPNFEKLIELNVFHLLVCDNEHLAVVFDKTASIVYIINKSDCMLINTVSIPRELNLSTIGINEDTYQIFLGTKRGQICILN